MPPLVTFLYYACLTLLAALGLFVWLRGRRSTLHLRFALGAAALFCWILTLFLYDRQADPSILNALGRLNFVSSDFAVLSAYLFVDELTGGKGRFRKVLFLETALLSLVTLATPLIDRSEVIRAEQRVTLFGPLFPLHVIHTIGYLAAAVLLALFAARNASRRLRGQLLVIGIGIGITAGVAVVADLVLPYGFHICSFQDAGPLSTVLLLVAIGYAISVQRLFDIRIIVKKTVVLTLLLATVHALYSGVILLVTDALPPGAGQYRFELEVLNIMVLAFGFEPLKRFLEREVDRLLYRREHSRRAVLAELAGRLAAATTLEQSLRSVLDALEEEFHPRFAAVFVLEADGEGILRVKRLEHTGHVTSARLLSLIQEPLLSYFSSHPEPLDVDALVRAHQKGRVRVRQASAQAAPRQVPEIWPSASESEIEHEVVGELASRQIAIVVPVSSPTGTTGLLVLGDSGTGERLRRSDLALLKGVAAQVGAVVSRSEFYDGTDAAAGL